MTTDRAEMVSKRLAHAKRTLIEIDILIENKLWNIAVNRLYYACFYAVTALLLKYDLDTKTHSGAQRMFSLHFIKPGVISRVHSDLYTNLMDMRQDADYEDGVEYEKEDVLELLEPAKSLIAEIERVLSKDIPLT